MTVKRTKNPSVMKHNFSQIPHANIQRSNFRRSHTHKTTFNSGYLVPIYVDEVLPGDTFKLNLTSVARLTTPLTPFMDNLMMDFFFFAVPNRLVWSNWRKFMGEQGSPGDSIDYLVPTVTSPNPAGFVNQSLFDYFGIPTQIPDLTVNALHSRAYNLIWNQWFRDENLQNSVVVDQDDGPDADTDYVLLRRGKRHDYFTACLPWPQKGAAVDLPLGTSAPVVGDGTALGFIDSDPITNTGGSYWYANSIHAGDNSYGAAVGGVATAASGFSNNDIIGVTTDATKSGLIADLSAATAATINSLREAFQLQKLFERDARGGSRYTEIIRSHFRVESPDARLQRAEYLGGGSTPVNIQPIATTAEITTNQTFVGDLAAIGYQNHSGIGFTKSFTEHCVIIGLVSVRADLTYQQGLNKMWSRQTKHDYYWPALAHLGEQEVLNKEIYAQGSLAATDDQVFGYQERWAEYRYCPSKITGKLRSNDAQSLDLWHLSQEFGSLPTLNATFIEDNPPLARVLKVTDPLEPQFKFDSFFDIVTTRPMPTYSVPGLIDHF